MRRIKVNAYQFDEEGKISRKFSDVWAHFAHAEKIPVININLDGLGPDGENQGIDIPVEDILKVIAEYFAENNKKNNGK